ncbi:MAG: glycosyltransferase family 2 protein [Candidatus Hodarchaeota archaeon]
MHQYNYDTTIIIPAYNEEKTLERIIQDSFAVFRNKDKTVEVIVVNDGSDDSSKAILENIQKTENNLTVIEHSHQLGKSQCLMDGFKLASGKFVGFIDADYQFHPEDFVRFFQILLEEEYDIVNGFREKREDPILKKISSKIFNFVNRIAFGDLNSRDWNSGIKLMRSEVAKNLNLRKGYHRFILGIAHNMGYKIKEIPIKHSKREYGRSKYGFMRLLVSPFDVLALKMKFVISRRPFTLFGFIGTLLVFIGVAFGLELIYEQQVLGRSLGSRTAPILVALFLLFGFLMFVFGYIAEKLSDIEARITDGIPGKILKAGKEKEYEK